MWKTIPLGEVCGISIGKTPPRKSTRYWDSDKNTKNIWVSIADLTKANGRTIGDSKEYLSDEGAALCKVVPAGTLLMSFKLSIGKLAVAETELLTNEAIAALPIKDERLLCRDYLFYYLASLNWDELAGSDVKIKGKTLNKAKLAKLPVNLPPLAEQKRIVERLDTAFAEIDKAIDLCEEKKMNVSSIIKNAIKNEVDRIAYNNGEVDLSSLCHIQNGFAFKSHRYKDSGTPILRISNIQDGAISTDNLVFASAEDYEEDLTQYKVPRGALVIAMSGATTGKVGINKMLDECYLNQRVGMFVPSEELEKDFLYYILSIRTEEHLKISAGAAQPNLSTKQIKQIQIPRLSLPEQRKLVDKFNIIEQEVRSLEEKTVKQTEGLGQLRAAVLKQELTPSEAV